MTNVAKTPRKNAIVSVEHTDDGNIVFNIIGAGSIILPVANLSDEVTARAVRHGLVQKITDAAALGKDATPSDKFEAMQAVTDRLIDGEWRASRGEGSAPVAGIIYRAFAEYVATMAAKAKKPAPDAVAVRALYDSRDRAGQLALRTVPAIATIIERMKAERGPVTSAVDTDALLADLGL